MRQFTTLQPRAFRDERLPTCGFLAGLLYCEAWLQADNFGRLRGSAARLLADVLPDYGVGGQVTMPQIQAARDELVQCGLWHLYQVEGEEYVEILTFDQGVSESWLPKRGSAPEHPDPPDRPERAVVRRLKYTPKAKPIKSEPPTEPCGDTESPAATATGMPTPGAEQGPAPAEEPPVTVMPTHGAAGRDGEHWAKWYERTYVVHPSSTDLRNMEDLQRTGVTDELIIAAIRQAVEQKANRPLGLARTFIADLVPYGVRTLADWERHKAELAKRSARADPTGYSGSPPELDEEESEGQKETRRKVQEQTTQLLEVAGHG